MRRYRHRWRDRCVTIETIITIAEDECRVVTTHQERGGEPVVVCDMPIPLHMAERAVEKYEYTEIVDTYHRNGGSSC